MCLAHEHNSRILVWDPSRVQDISVLPTQFKICLLYSVWTSRGAKHSFAKSQCGCKEWLAHMQAFFALVRETESYIDRHHYSIYIRVALSEGPSYVATLSSISWFLLIWLNEAAIISDLHSMKWLGEFLLPLRWDGRPSQVLPLTPIIRSQCLPKNGWNYTIQTTSYTHNSLRCCVPHLEILEVAGQSNKFKPGTSKEFYSN